MSKPKIIIIIFFFLQITVFVPQFENARNNTFDTSVCDNVCDLEVFFLYLC